ncbi:DUF4153 domain-containing protein [Nocardioides aequoreus]|uniref:DUF4153 domain-containing protein n=1 Tax=Nocardioides aequoreus TaxID=397278 RepID=UPI000A9C6DF8|nr:DUF4153 domain-containing protein [Nocardioides aequoreus]
MSRLEEPLRRVTSLKLKLGLLVAASVVVAAWLATLGARSVPAWLSIPVTVLLALAVTQLLATGMTSPLREMTGAARRMAGGDYAVRVTDSGSDEVGQLARAFNTMAADLAAVDRQRRELVANVSHELRTPLTGLVALLENVADGVTPADPRTLRTALDQAEHLSGLVGDLLDLSRVDAGLAPLRRDDVAVAPLLARAVAEAGPLAASREVRLESTVSPPGLTTYADPDRLRQVVANLVDNACRHSPPGGTVRLAATAHEGGLRLVVSDEGAGIDEADRERVFERFGTAGGGGTGLGLAIARWVTDLHGGRIEVLDPPAHADRAPGAHVRVDLPARDRTLPVPPAPRRPSVSTSVPAAPAPAPTPPASNLADDLFGPYWPDRAAARPAALLACLAVGLLGAVALPFATPHVGATTVLLAAGGVVLWLSPRRREPFVVASAVVCVGLALVLTLRDALWVGTLGLLAALVLVPVALAGARSVPGMLAAGLAWPLSGLRGIPWLGRCVRAATGRGGAVALVRTAVLGLGAALLLGLLLASADAVFGRWFDAVVPDLGSSLVLRIFVGVAVAGVVLAAAYLAMSPPQLDQREPVRRPTRERYEWLAPVLLVDAVLLVFLAAQAAAFFGGHDFVQRTTGLTYAEYVHQGFGQLTVATVLTLAVVAIAARKAGVETRADRAWLRGSTGLLCVLTLAVVASALERMWLYTDAYGLTRLRLTVAVFETWLGLVVVGVLVAGVALRGRWLPRAAVLLGATMVLGLGLANPDAMIARTNLDRPAELVDWAYLTDLSDDAVPVVAEQPEEVQRCALPYSFFSPDSSERAWAAWNLGRARADALRDDLPTTWEGVECPAADPFER